SGQGRAAILTSSNPLSTLHRRFACARLSQPCLPESCPGVSATLTTIAFDNSSLRWLEISTPNARLYGVGARCSPTLAVVVARLRRPQQWQAAPSPGAPAAGA